jgi:signal transduction histidine kinase
MKLTKKIILFVGFVCILFSMLYFLLFRFILTTPIEEQKHVRARKIMGGAIAALQRESKRIKNFAEDWAMWDTMYAFTSNPNQGMLNDLNPPMTLKDADLSFLAILDKNKKLLVVSGYDHMSSKTVVFGQFRQKTGEVFKFLEFTFDEARTQSGMVRSEHGFLLLVSAPVLHSDDSGPANGRVIMGRFIDGSFEQAMAGALGEDVRLVSGPFPLPDSPVHYSGKTPFTLKEVAERLILHYPVYDAWNRLLFSVRIDAGIGAFGILESATRLFFLLLIVGFVLLGGVFYYIIHRLVVRRVRHISVKTGEIISFDDLSRRVPVRHKDEIALLSDNINRMLCRLQEENIKRQEMEHTLMLNEKLIFLGKVTSKIAHEVNNPLFAIENSFQHLLKHLPAGNEKLDKVARLMGKEIRRVRAITRDMHQYSIRQIDTFAASDLAGIIQDAVDVITWSKQLKETRVDFPGREGAYPIYCNPETLQQVFMNLIVNAVEAMAGKGSITIHINDKNGEGEQYKVEVTDTGPGINDDIRPVVFAPFQTTKTGQGAGLGLYICQNIILDHGGAITPDYSYTGGTRFVLRIPKNAAPRANPKGGNGNGTQSSTDDDR